MSNESLHIDLAKIKMSSVEVVSFQINNSAKETYYKRHIKGANFIFNTEFAYDLEGKGVLVTIHTQINAIPNRPTEEDIGGSCVIEFVFDVDDLDRYFEGDESQILERKFGIDASFVYTLLGLSFSTARGIIFSRTLGTMLDGILLPVVAPKELLSTT